VEVIMLSGPRAGEPIGIAGALTVGRDPRCGLVLHDATVSRRHATLIRGSPAALAIRDEGSLNGTWVNDVRLTASRALRAGDRVRIGSSELAVRGATGAAGQEAVTILTAETRDVAAVR
jgi:pSer/pThr/pTyr-binding forkhead associated (FHA) protein